MNSWQTVDGSLIINFHSAHLVKYVKISRGFVTGCQLTYSHGKPGGVVFGIARPRVARLNPGCGARLRWDGLWWRDLPCM